jgi:hypothetical protein
MSSSGVAYPPPNLPFVSIFNPTNFPPIPQAGTAGSNNFPNGINLTGTSGSARTITGISNLEFVSETSTSSSGLLTQISQTDTEMIIGTPAPAGTQEINIYGSALLFNNVALGTGNGNVSTTSDNTYVGLTNQDFYDASVRDNLTFPNSPSSIILNNTLGFQNANATSNPLRLRNTSAIEWYLEPIPSTTPTPNLLNFHLSFGGMSIYLDATFINLNATSAVQISNILTSPNNPTINSTSLSPSSGTFYPFNKLPYFTYNDGGVFNNYPLVVSSTLSNYATLTTGTNSFTNVNTFSQFPTISATQLLSTDSSTKLATTAWVQSAIPSLTNYATLTTGTNGFTNVNTFSQFPTISATQLLSTDSSTKLATTAWVQSAIPSLTNYATLTTGTNGFTNVNTFSQFPTISATQLPANDSSTKLATTAWVQSAIPSLSNTPTLAGNNNFTGNNNFSQYITNATQSLITTTSIPANQATFFGRVISGNIVPYFGWTDGTTALNNQLPQLNSVNAFTEGSSFPYIKLPNQSTTNSILNALYVSGGALTFNYGVSPTQVALVASPVFTGIPQAPTPPLGDNSNRIATTAFLYNSGLLSATTITSNSSTTNWTFNFPANANYGYSFRFIISTATGLTSQSYNGTAQQQLTTNYSYGIITGNATIQTFVFTDYGIPAIGYLCSAISSVGAGLTLGRSYANYPNTWSLNVSGSLPGTQSLKISIFPNTPPV